MASAPVVWDIVRNFNSYLVKRDGLQLSKDPLNVMNVHSFKYAGFANGKAVGVVVQKKGKKQTVALLTSNKHASKPAKSVTVTGLNRKPTKAVTAVNKAVFSTNYRPDLRKEALARFSKLNSALGVKATGVTKKARRANPKFKPSAQ